MGGSVSDNICRQRPLQAGDANAQAMVSSELQLGWFEQPKGGSDFRKKEEKRYI
jgi:hypothetical protein